MCSARRQRSSWARIKLFVKSFIYAASRLPISSQTELQRFYSLFVRFLRITFRRFLDCVFTLWNSSGSFRSRFQNLRNLQVGSFLTVLFNFQAPVRFLSSFNLSKKHNSLYHSFLSLSSTFYHLFETFSSRPMIFCTLLTSSFGFPFPVHRRCFEAAYLSYHISSLLSRTFFVLFKSFSMDSIGLSRWQLYYYILFPVKCQLQNFIFLNLMKISNKIRFYKKFSVVFRKT